MILISKFEDLLQSQNNLILYNFFEAHKVELYLVQINLSINFVFFYNQNLF